MAGGIVGLDGSILFAGFDPGSRYVGYALLNEHADLLDAGYWSIAPRSKVPMLQRMLSVEVCVSTLAAAWSTRYPSASYAVSIEHAVSGKNARSDRVLATATGWLQMALAKSLPLATLPGVHDTEADGLGWREINPTTVKQMVGLPSADKETMVGYAVNVAHAAFDARTVSASDHRLIVDMLTQGPGDHAADAIAVAQAGWGQMREAILVARAEGVG